MELEKFASSYHVREGFPGSSAGKNPPTMQETPVGSLSWEDPLDKGQAAHSSSLGLTWWLSW